MAEFHTTPPNICCLLFDDEANVAYFYTGDDHDLIITPGPNLTNFEQFVTQDEAAVRAVEINPNFDVSVIFGYLTLTPVNVSPFEVNVSAGSNLVLDAEYSCEGAEITYQWYNPHEEEIPGATGSQLVIEGVTSRDAGIYACNADARNARGQSGCSRPKFNVKVTSLADEGTVAE